MKEKEIKIIVNMINRQLDFIGKKVNKLVYCTGEKHFLYNIERITSQLYITKDLVTMIINDKKFKKLQEQLEDNDE